MERLRAAYNGYWFGRTHDAQPAKMYNADMVLYFVRFILSDGRFPENGELIDPNASISNKILTFAGSLPWLGGLLVAPLAEKLITFRSPAVTVDMEEIMVLFRNPLDPKARDIFWQLLYYYGALTTQGINRDFNRGYFLISMSPTRSRKTSTWGLFGSSLTQRLSLLLPLRRQISAFLSGTTTQSPS